MCEKHDFSSEFQTHNKWIDDGTTYSRLRLVEMLDIAHDYLINPKGKSYLPHIINNSFSKF